MKNFSLILNILIVLTLLFLIGKAIYIERTCKKKSNKTDKFAIFSGITLVNIGLLILAFAYITANNINLFSMKYIFILLILIMIVFQAFASSRLVLFNKGLLCMGQYLDSKNINKVLIREGRFASTVVIEGKGDSFNFRIGKKRTDLLSKSLRENRVNVKMCG
ncbi:MAG: hypothetical protein RSD13_02215 [Clostridium sp.]